MALIFVFLGVPVFCGVCLIWKNLYQGNDQNSFKHINLKMNFEQLTQACEQAHNYLQGTAVSAINQSLTIRNWLFGHYIVEYEQKGEDRAKYGVELLKKLADRLISKHLKGLSDRNLRNCRQFYLAYPQLSQALSDSALPKSIWQTVSAKSENSLKQTAIKGVNPKLLLIKLSFSHIIELAREEDLLPELLQGQRISRRRLPSCRDRAMYR